MFFRKRKEESKEQVSASIACFKECSDKLKNGAPIYPFPDNADLFFNVLRVGTHQQQIQMEEVRKAVYGFNPPRHIDHNLLFAHWLGNYGVTGWGYLEDENGKELKFTRETCRKIFLDEYHRNFLVPTLINGASDAYAYLSDEAIEAIEELKKR
jgi:hypothetical protein